MNSNCAKVAVEIRKLLKEKFPDTKFSVKSKTASMSECIYISYTDGPSRQSVRDAVEKFCGKWTEGFVEFITVLKHVV